MSPRVDAAGVTSPFLHDSSITLLTPATNLDPNPSKGLGHLTLSEGVALVPETGPVGTLAAVEGVSTTDQISLYVVREGDTLSDIAGMFGVSVNTIVWANDLGLTRNIRPGQQLIILPVTGVEHTVRKGDTLATLAKKYAAEVEEIAEFNGLDPATPLDVDTELIIPGGEMAPSPTRSIVAANIYGVGSGAALNGYFTNPLSGAVLTQGVHGWNGIDLGAPQGTPIRAAANGVVLIAKNSGWNKGYGNYVVILHPNGVQTLYAHFTRGIVSVGQEVMQGQIIGYVGNTGLSTGHHLHFEVRGAKNPFSFCPVGRVCEPR